MNQGFWAKLKKPFFVMAPLANVTDAAFRQIIAKYGKPDVLWTEFVSADGLVLAHPEGKKKLMRDLLYTKAERPIVAQFFTSTPEHMKKAAELARELGFDGIDINMGCPDRSIEKQNAGAALMKNPKLAREVIRAAMEGAGNLPVSVKTRIGYNKNELETWLPEILAENPVAVTIHARTRKEMSLVPARWEHVKRAVEIRDELKSQTLILGNGDVLDMNDARMKAEESGADGVMLGRAIFGNPWLFASLSSSDEEEYPKGEVFDLEDTKHPGLWPPLFRKRGEGREPTLEEKFRVMLEHTKLFEKLLGDIKNFAIMKKHFKAYVHGFDGAHELRAKLMETNNYKEVKVLVREFLKTHKTL